MRGVAAEQLEEGRAEQVDVRARRDGLAEDHLRREVDGRAGEDARVVGAEVRAGRALPLGGRDGHGDAPVHQVDLAVGADHHVVGLDVPVHDAARVGRVGRAADLHEGLEVPAERVLHAEARAEARRRLEELGPGLALDALEDDERRAVLGQREVVDREHVRVLEAPREDGLAEELAGRRGLAAGAAEILADGLDGDRAPEGRLLAEPDVAHAAAAELLVRDLEALGRRGVDLAEQAERSLAGRGDGDVDGVIGGGRDDGLPRRVGDRRRVVGEGGPAGVEVRRRRGGGGGRRERGRGGARRLPLPRLRLLPRTRAWTRPLARLFALVPAHGPPMMPGPSPGVTTGLRCGSRDRTHRRLLKPGRRGATCAGP